MLPEDGDLERTVLTPRGQLPGMLQPLSLQVFFLRN